MQKKSRHKFLCLDCKIDTGKAYEHYMLIDKIWSKIHNSNKGMLCIGCAETRLGRRLNSGDFKDCHVNNPKLYNMSARLLQRIRNHEEKCL